MTRPLLVLQHIACEPPAAYEDELRAWGADLDRIEVAEGEPLPDWRAFHLEVDVALATEWGAVPAYAQSLRELLGGDGLPTLLTALARHEDESVAHARRLFAAWLEHVVGLTPPAAAAAPAATDRPA